MSTTQNHAPPPPPPSSSDNNFPILAISILGILTTSILLLAYYLFVTKSCFNWRRSRLPLTNPHPSQPLFQPQPQSLGLPPSLIQSLPILRFSKSSSSSSSNQCSICLTDFQPNEHLRLLPSCSHSFHIDCIDIWLQSHPNCPLCRSLILSQDFHRTPTMHPQLTTSSSPSSPPPPPRPLLPLRKAPSFGHECIDLRPFKDDTFSIQPIRRSFSMDSSADRQLYLSVQQALQRGRHFQEQEQEDEDVIGSSGSKVRRSFFSFGHGRSSRTSSVLPIQFEM
ncbi:E3 ubiquitin-protein ligase RNF38/44 protein [Dioscorea alata]|uniref:E3 ubiquitin-protein ligase RNF38/44 protein n=1 Tax=Dioscorea alata TaxID=55571 RepID=A0ACB7WQA4_DIOAL|nr:E3 ubiquitin-protein ligase RNF38/44 protein [Dioscorea alata]